PLTLPTPTNPTPPSNPPFHNDALTIRSRVFITEQNCTPEGEIDSDEPRSWQWVIYADDKPTEKPLPVAVIRLVPPPHAPHSPHHTETATDNTNENTKTEGKWDTEHEPYLKLTRVAVLKEWRGYGLGRKLVDEALGWAGRNKGEIMGAYRRVVGAEGGGGMEGGAGTEWKGLVLVHAQTQVEGMYERVGFKTDEGLGRWDEEGIEHLGMWRRISVS
ncbi:hypothetical protein BO71DRAFT_475061, partial [Aspergillus ellipticus CBS 707.79]